MASGGESVVVYAQWRDAPDGLDWSSSKILRSIRDYNIDDCDSTLELAEWLRKAQYDAGIGYKATGDSSGEVDEREPDEGDILQESLLELAGAETETDENRFLGKTPCIPGSILPARTQADMVAIL